MANSEKNYRIAVASSDGIVVNQHFGRADTFHIYEIGSEQEIRFLEKRKSTPVCQGGVHDDRDMQKRAEQFRDCRYILVSRIGPGAANVLEAQGIHPMELPGLIEDSVTRLITYNQVQELFC